MAQPTSDAPGFEATYFFSDLTEALDAVRGAVLLDFSFHLEDRWTIDEIVDPHTESTLQSRRYHLRVTEVQTYEAGPEAVE